MKIATLTGGGTVEPYRDRGSLIMALGLTASGAQDALDQLEAGCPAAAKLTLRVTLSAAKQVLVLIETAGGARVEHIARPFSSMSA